MVYRLLTLSPLILNSSLNWIRYYFSVSRASCVVRYLVTCHIVRISCLTYTFLYIPAFDTFFFVSLPHLTPFLHVFLNFITSHSFFRGYLLFPSGVYTLSYSLYYPSFSLLSSLSKFLDLRIYIADASYSSSIGVFSTTTILCLAIFLVFSSGVNYQIKLLSLDFPLLYL